MSFPPKAKTDKRWNPGSNILSKNSSYSVVTQPKQDTWGLLWMSHRGPENQRNCCKFDNNTLHSYLLVCVLLQNKGEEPQLDPLLAPCSSSYLVDGILALDALATAIPGSLQRQSFVCHPAFGPVIGEINKLHSPRRVFHSFSLLLRCGDLIDVASKLCTFLSVG